MLQPKNLAIRKNIIRPPFTRTSARMTTSRVSTPPVSRASKPLVSRVKADHPVSVVTVRNAQSARSVMAAAARRVAGSAMTSVRRVVPVRTSPNV